MESCAERVVPTQSERGGMNIGGCVRCMTMDIPVNSKTGYCLDCERDVEQGKEETT